MEKIGEVNKANYKKKPKELEEKAEQLDFFYNQES